jgi:hypothetical protein
MPKTHKPHRTPTAYEREILLLTCLLRLRITPSVPYPLIATILLTTLPKHVQQLMRNVAPPSLEHERSENGTKDWLAGYFEESYRFGEQGDSGPWLAAGEFDGGRVREVLKVVGLEGNGYRVLVDEEARVQVRWRRAGDWRAVGDEMGWVGKEVFGREARREDGERSVEPKGRSIASS